MKTVALTATVGAAVIYLTGLQATAEECSKSDALACYTQALVKLQTARDELVAATRGIDAISHDLKSAHTDIDDLKKANKELASRLSKAEERLDSIKVVVKHDEFDVSPQAGYGAEVSCPQEKGLRSYAIASGMFLNESNEANASFLRWYTWPASPTSFRYFMRNAAGTGMGHPPGKFSAYIGCLLTK